ncbi:MAG: hypothetical protein ACMXX7_00110 [Candidatus Woesearchaeota archaeon]
MVFKSSTRISVLLIVLILFAYSFIGYIGQNINYVSLEGFSIVSIDNISSSSFHLNADLFLNNPTGIMVPVKIISFDVFLDDNLLASGFISSFRLGAGQVSRVGFEQKIDSDLSVFNLSSIVEIKGVIHLDFIFTPEYRIPFSDTKMLSEIVPSNILSLSDDGHLIIID